MMTRCYSATALHGELSTLKECYASLSAGTSSDDADSLSVEAFYGQLLPFLMYTCTFVVIIYYKERKQRCVAVDFVLLRLEKNMGNVINIALNNIHEDKVPRVATQKVTINQSIKLMK